MGFINGGMRPGDLKLSLRGVSIHGEKMGNNGIIPRKQGNMVCTKGADVTTELEET
jgi:hypothetical protein